MSRSGVTTPPRLHAGRYKEISVDQGVFMNATTTTRECAAAVDDKNQYTLYPPLLPSWSRLRKLFGRGSDLSVLRALEYELMGQIRFSGRILDFGGGSNANYRELLRQWMAGCTYETANIDGDIGPTHLIRPGQPLPIADDSYDFVITLNTLEHIYEIEAALGDLLRVLLPDGQLIATVPFLFRIHGHPDDFLRGTPSWWARILCRIGFSHIVIAPLLWGPLSTGLSVSGIPGPFKRGRMQLALILDMLHARRNCPNQLRYSGELAKVLCNSPLGFLITACKPGEHPTR